MVDRQMDGSRSATSCGTARPEFGRVHELYPPAGGFYNVFIPLKLHESVARRFHSIGLTALWVANGWWDWT